MYVIYSNPTLTHSIVWNNSPESIYLYTGDEDPLITYSDVEGGWEGLGNIDADPLFIDPDGGDYSLQDGSPCIDAGTADIDGDGVDDITDYAGSAPDMGAYEYMDSLEFSYGDVTMDGIIDVLDVIRVIAIIMDNWDPTDTEFLLGDMNSDGVIDILDAIQIVQIIIS